MHLNEQQKNFFFNSNEKQATNMAHERFVVRLGRGEKHLHFNEKKKKKIKIEIK